MSDPQKPKIPRRALKCEPLDLPPPPRRDPPIQGLIKKVQWAVDVRGKLSHGIYQAVEKMVNDPRADERTKRLADLVRRFLFWMDDADFWIDSKDFSGRQLVEWFMNEPAFLKAVDQWKKQEAGRDDISGDGWNRIQGRLHKPGQVWSEDDI